MSSNTNVTNGSKKRRLLAPSQKYEVFTQVLTGQYTQREAAARWRVDRTTVTSICRTAKEGALAALSAKPGRAGKTPEQVELDETREQVAKLQATVAEQAIALHLYEGKTHWD